MVKSTVSVKYHLSFSVPEHYIISLSLSNCDRFMNFVDKGRDHLLMPRTDHLATPGIFSRVFVVVCKSCSVTHWNTMFLFLFFNCFFFFHPSYYSLSQLRYLLSSVSEGVCEDTVSTADGILARIP